VTDNPAPAKRKAFVEPWLPADYEPADIGAMKALAAGTARPDQQQRVLDWIINKACQTFEPSFRPGGHEGDRLTSFAEGKRYVGNQIIKMTKISVVKRET